MPDDRLDRELAEFEENERRADYIASGVCPFCKRDILEQAPPSEWVHSSRQPCYPLERGEAARVTGTPEETPAGARADNKPGQAARSGTDSPTSDAARGSDKPSSPPAGDAAAEADSDADSVDAIARLLDPFFDRIRRELEGRAEGDVPREVAHGARSASSVVDEVLQVVSRRVRALIRAGGTEAEVRLEGRALEHATRRADRLARLMKVARSRIRERAVPEPARFFDLYGDEIIDLVEAIAKDVPELAREIKALRGWS